MTGSSYLRLEIVGVVVGVVGVHWLLLQTFSHVARIQLKVLEAGDRSSQVGYNHFQLLAWILQEGCFQEWMQREHASLAIKVLDVRGRQEDAPCMGFQPDWSLQGTVVLRGLESVEPG